MAFTEQELNVLRGLQKKGYNQEDALKVLDEAKSKLNTSGVVSRESVAVRKSQGLSVPDQIKSLRSQGLSEEDINKRISATLGGVPTETPGSPKSLLGSEYVADKVKEGVKGSLETAAKTAQEARDFAAEGDTATRLLKTAEAGVQLAKAPIRAAEKPLEPVFSKVSDFVSDFFSSGIRDQVEFEHGKEKADSIIAQNQEAMTRDIQAVIDTYQALPEPAKAATELAVEAAEIPLTLAGGKSAKQGLDEGLVIAKEEIALARKQAKNNAIAKLESAIETGIEKGVRPGLTNEKKTIKGFDNWQQRARDAVNSIIDNKDNLELVDEFGEKVEGLPQNLKQFADSISQTKQSIFTEYDSLAKQAGDKGATLELKGIAQDLGKIQESKALQVERPDIVKYAQERAERYLTESYTPQEAQDAIKILNQSLESFYKNPSFDSASKAYVDSLIANNLRTNLDDVIQSLTGSEYQVLKNKYASLRAIEKDVIHRALVDARRNNKGLLDFTDIFSGGDVVNGILSLNPGLVAKGAFQKGVKEWFKFLNDPNVLIKKVFQDAQKSNLLASQVK